MFLQMYVPKHCTIYPACDWLLLLKKSDSELRYKAIGVAHEGFRFTLKQVRHIISALILKSYHSKRCTNE